MNKILPKVKCAGECFPDEYKLLEENGYSKLNLDAQMKWCAILEKIKLLKPGAKTFLDVGGGYAATTFLLSEYGKVTNVDFSYTGNWFKTNPDGTLPGLKNYNLKNIEFIQMNFLENSDLLKDNYYDVVMDGCAIIHFKPESVDDIENVGLYKAAKNIYKKLKKDGIFVISSDMNNNVEPPTAEWLKPQTFVRIVQKAGFELIGDTNLTVTANSFDVGECCQHCGRNLTYLTIGSLAFRKT